MAVDSLKFIENGWQDNPIIKISSYAHRIAFPQLYQNFSNKLQSAFERGNYTSRDFNRNSVSIPFNMYVIFVNR